MGPVLGSVERSRGVIIAGWPRASRPSIYGICPRNGRKDPPSSNLLPPFSSLFRKSLDIIRLFFLLPPRRTVSFLTDFFPFLFKKDIFFLTSPSNQCKKENLESLVSCRSRIGNNALPKEAGTRTIDSLDNEYPSLSFPFPKKIPKNLQVFPKRNFYPESS